MQTHHLILQGEPLRDTVLYLFPLYYKVWQVFVKLHYKVVLLWNEKWYSFKVLQKNFPSLSPSPTLFLLSHLSSFHFRSFFSSFLLYLLAMAIWMLALVCTYLYLCQPSSHPNCLTLIVCMAAGPLDWRMCSMADAAGRFSSSIMANSVNITHDRPYPSIQLKREGRMHQCVYSIIDTPLHWSFTYTVFWSHNHVVHYWSGMDLYRQEERWERVGIRTSLIPRPFH